MEVLVYIGMVVIVALICVLGKPPRELPKCDGCDARIQGHYVNHDGMRFCMACARACALRGCRCHSEFKCHND